MTEEADNSCLILQWFLLITPFPRFKNTHPDGHYTLQTLPTPVVHTMLQFYISPPVSGIKDIKFKLFFLNVVTLIILSVSENGKSWTIF